jgi:hypothetical protein
LIFLLITLLLLGPVAVEGVVVAGAVRVDFGPLSRQLGEEVPLNLL